MEAGSSVSMRVITVITRRTQPCEALFFTRARKLHTNCRRTDFWRGMVRFAKASARQSSFDHCEASEGWRRGESNPCAHSSPEHRCLSQVRNVLGCAWKSPAVASLVASDALQNNQM